MIDYNTHVKPYECNFKLITIPKYKLLMAENYARAVIRQKEKEPHHKIDSGRTYQRFLTGVLGEIAVEEVLNCDIVDWSIGNSDIYNVADLGCIGIDIGVKTVEYGNFPVIHKSIKRPEIINLKISNKEILICGVATIGNMLQYRNDCLIKSPALLRRGTKTGFYGFKELIPFDNIVELKTITGDIFNYA